MKNKRNTQKQKDLELLTWVEENQPIYGKIDSSRYGELMKLWDMSLISGNFTPLNLCGAYEPGKGYEVNNIRLNSEGHRYFRAIQKEVEDARLRIWVWRDYGKPILIGLVLLIIGFLLGKYYG